MRFSLIIAAYNVENYIKKCIDSILNQDYENEFEIIIVNDCSTDRTALILEDYTKINNVKIINNPINLNLSKTRQIGINYANGDYILNIDGDDSLESTTLSTLNNYIDLFSPDVIAFNLCLEFANGNKILPDSNFIYSNVIDPEKKECVKYFMGATVTKLVKKNLCKDLKFSDYSISNSEDMLFCTEVLIKSKKIVLISKI